MTIPPPEPYNPNIPLPDDNLAQSQIGFLNNFATLYDAFAMNHVPLDAVSEAGNHTYVELVEQGNDPQTNQGEISVYTKNVPGQTDQVFLKYQNGTVLQYTNYQIYAARPFDTYQTRFFTFLPGKVLAYFGTFNAPASPSGNTLYLYPHVARNVITANFCPIGASSANSSYAPAFTLEQGIPPFYTALRLQKAASNRPLTNYFYFVLANI